MESEDRASLFRQIIFQEFEIQHITKTIIAHYEVQVDILDSKCNVIASRTSPKTFKIQLNGINESSDANEIAEKCINKCEILKEAKKTQLVNAINDLKGGPIRPASTTTRSPSTDQFVCRTTNTAPSFAPRSGSAPQLQAANCEDIQQVLCDMCQKMNFGTDNEKFAAFAKLADLSKLDRNLALMLSNEPIMNTLMQMIKENNTKSLPNLINIMFIFERMSFFEEYKASFPRFSIGSWAVKLLIVQLALADKVQSSISKEEFEKYIRRQNKLIKSIVSILFNISSDGQILSKMVQKSIADTLPQVLKRRDLEILLLSLRLLRRIALHKLFWGDIAYDQIIDLIVSNVFKIQGALKDKRSKVVLVLQEAIELLFTFSFHQEVIKNFGSSGVFDALVKLAEIPELRSSITRLIYQSTISADNYSYFRKNVLLDFLIYTATNEGTDHAISLVILMRLSSDKTCSQMISQSPVFTSQNVKKMFVEAANNANGDSAILLHLIRNIADHQPDLVKDFDDAIISACLNNKDNQSVLSDIFAVSSRAKVDTKRAAFFASNEEFINLIVSIFKDSDALPQLHLECVMLVSSIVLFSKPSEEFRKHGIVEGVVNVFLSHSDDIDIQTQCLFCFYRFACHTETRNTLISLLSQNKITNVIIQHSGSKNKVLNSMANSFLDMLVTFDQKWADIIKKPRFIAFNKDWISEMEKAAK